MSTKRKILEAVLLVLSILLTAAQSIHAKETGSGHSDEL